MDKPKGDAQNLSAARGRFDQNDYSGAMQYYNQLSSAASDTAESEEAFESLTQNGFTMSVFMQVEISKPSSGGVFITRLAERLTSYANLTTRLAFFHAYQKTSKISNTQIQGWVRFLTATALTAEIFAESAQTSGKILKTDIVINPTDCLKDPSFNAINCGRPSNSPLITGSSIILTTATDRDISGPAGKPTLYLLNASISEIIKGIVQLQSLSDLTKNIVSFENSLSQVGFSSNSVLEPNYRANLIKFGIGE